MRFIFAVLLALILPATALAQCVNPPAEMGVIIFNKAHKVMQYCNGDQWVGMRGGGGIPAVPVCDAVTEKLHWTGSAWQCVQSAAGKTKICLEGDNCSGTPLLCGAHIVGSDATTGHYITLADAPAYQIAFGPWTNAPCGASGSGWSVRYGSCSTGIGSARVRCVWVLVEE